MMRVTLIALVMMAITVSGTVYLREAKYGSTDATCTSTATIQIDVSPVDVCVPSEPASTKWTGNATSGVYTKWSWDNLYTCYATANSSASFSLNTCTSYNGAYSKFSLVNTTQINLVQAFIYSQDASCTKATMASYYDISQESGCYGGLFKYSISGGGLLQQMFSTSPCSGSVQNAVTWTNAQCYGGEGQSVKYLFTGAAAASKTVGSVVIMAMVATIVSMMW